MKYLFSLLVFGSLFAVVFIGIYVSSLKRAETMGIRSPLAESITYAAEVTPSPIIVSDLPNVVAKSLQGTRGTYSIVIKNLKTGEAFASDENHQFASASLYKLWVMATAYEQIKEGKLTPDQQLTESVESLNKKFDIASESAELTEGKISFSVDNAMYQMITVSHNYAALLLTSKLRVSNLKTFVEAHGLRNSQTGSPPRTTAYDTALFLEKLYQGMLVGKEQDAKMVDILTKQQMNDRIPKYLPTGTRIAHKTGELDGVKHDASIVYTPFGDYIFVVLSESTNPKAAAERIAVLSRDVYTYFANRKTQ